MSMRKLLRTVPAHRDGKDGDQILVRPVYDLLDLLGTGGVNNGRCDELLFVEYGHHVVGVWVYYT